jgi:hypothetical protein
MTNHAHELIGGTIIQRSFVASGVAHVVNIATVPISEVVRDLRQIDENEALRVLTAEILGIPAETVIDENQYLNLVGFLQRSDPHALMERKGLLNPFLRKEYSEWQRRLRASMADGTDKQFLVRFAEDVVSLLTNRISQVEKAWYWTGADNIIRNITANLEEQEIAIDEDAVVTGLACIAARLGCTEKVKAFTTALMDYDIPLGQSPAVKSDSLLTLLANGRAMCLAPLAAGGTPGVSELGQGQYVAALLSVGTGSAMTLMLLGTITVGVLLIQRVAQQRARKKNGNR